MDKYCCPHCASDDIELVPKADGVKFDVRPQLKDGKIRIYSGNTKIGTVDDLIELAMQNACEPYAACHTCTAEFNFTGEEAWFEEGE